MRYLHYPNLLLIGLMSNTGPQSGKSTTAEIIKHFCPNLCFKTSLAEPVKKVTHKILEEIIGNACYSGDKSLVIMTRGDGKKITLRELYVLIGTKCFRELVDANTWIDILHNKLCNYAQGTKEKTVIVIDDVRFQNEIDYIHLSGGKVFNIVDTTGDKKQPDAGNIVLPNDVSRIISLYNNKVGGLLKVEIANKVLPVLMEFYNKCI